MQLETSRFNQVITAAKEKASADARCLRAIDRAVEMLGSAGWSFDNRTGVLTVCGSDGALHTATAETCTCKAFTQFSDRRCKHRIAAKLLARYFDQLPIPSRPVQIVTPADSALATVEDLASQVMAERASVGVAVGKPAKQTVSDFLNSRAARLSDRDLDEMAERWERESAPLIKRPTHDVRIDGYQI